MCTSARLVSALFFLALSFSVVACDSGVDGNDSGDGVEANAYRLSGTPNAQVFVSIQTTDGGSTTGGSGETTTIEGGGIVTESMNLDDDVVGVRVTVNGGQGATSLELLDEGNAVLDSDSGSGPLTVEDGDVSTLP